MGNAGQVSERSRAFSRPGALDGVSEARCSCARPGAPTLVCMRLAKWPMLTFRWMRYPTPIHVRRGLSEPEFLPLVRRLGRLLPSDVRVHRIIRAPAGFDARFSALRRHYVYRLSTAPYGVEPHQARYITAWPRLLDVDAMTEASRNLLLGLHDFAAFCRHREGCYHDSRSAAVGLDP